MLSLSVTKTCAALVAFVTVVPAMSDVRAKVPAELGKVTVTSAVDVGPINVTLFVPLSLSSKTLRNLHLSHHFLIALQH